MSADVQSQDVYCEPFYFDDKDMPVANPELMRRILIKSRRRAGVPDRYVRVGFGDIAATWNEQRERYGLVRAYTEKFRPRDYPGMIICGHVGTGKTMNACAMCNYLSDRGHEVLFVSLSEMLDRIRDTYSSGKSESKSQVLEDYISYDLLIIDEIGVHHGTTDERNILSRIIDGRYNKMRPTLLVGNLDRQEMIDYMGEHCIDRVLSGGGPLLVFDWDSMRGGIKR